MTAHLVVNLKKLISDWLMLNTHCSGVWYQVPGVEGGHDSDQQEESSDQRCCQESGQGEDDQV